MKKRIVLLLLAIFFYGVCAFAYVTYPKAVLSVDSDTLNVGDSIKATVEITIPPFAKLLQTEEDVSIEGWDILDFHFKQDILDESKFVLDLVITTFNSKLDSVSKVKLSYINKDDLLNDTFFCDKFYFYSNAVPVKVNSIVSDHQRKEMFDIKSVKEMNIPVLFYVFCFLFVLFVLFVVYKELLITKVKEIDDFCFSPREIAIRELNRICLNEKQIQSININNSYVLMSRVLKFFILDELNIKNKEMTTSEILELLSDETSIFHKNYYDILSLFKIYDNAKYSVETLNLRMFFDLFNKTKHMIETLSVGSEKY